MDDSVTRMYMQRIKKDGRWVLIVSPLTDEPVVDSNMVPYFYVNRVIVRLPEDMKLVVERID